MLHQEFEDQFDVLYNNITSNQAPGLDSYEKSVFLTKAQDEILKAYFNPVYNKGNEGFDDNQRRQIDFSALMSTCTCQIVDSGNTNKFEIVHYISPDNTIVRTLNPRSIVVKEADTVIQISQLEGKGTIDGNTLSINGETYQIEGLDYEEGSLVFKTFTAGAKIDDRSILITFPPGVLMIVNEQAKTTDGKRLAIVPINYAEYFRLMSKPYKRPLKYQAWRLLNTTNNASYYAEVLTGVEDKIDTYIMRYVRRPRPIILADLDGLTINGEGNISECELDEILHQEILQRAVELAKAAYSGTLQDVVQAGAISSTEKGVVPRQ